MKLKVATYAKKKEETRKHRKTRDCNKKFKEKEKIKNKNYQKIANGYKRALSKKGMGRSMKIKGEIRPSLVDSGVAKGWRYVGYGKSKPLTEGFKLTCIWNIT